nr:MAG TPA: hypothetical protein [Caudoviricetes sp.]
MKTPNSLPPQRIFYYCKYIKNIILLYIIFAKNCIIFSY